MPLACVVTLLTTLIVVHTLADPKRRFHRNLFFLAPVAWLVFCAMDMIEL